MPPDVELVDTQSSCEIELPEGTKSITVKIKGACKQGAIKGGLQAIIPHISYVNSRFWSQGKDGLSTIWVCIYMLLKLGMRK